MKILNSAECKLCCTGTAAACSDSLQRQPAATACSDSPQRQSAATVRGDSLQEQADATLCRAKENPTEISLSPSQNVVGRAMFLKFAPLREFRIPPGFSNRRTIVHFTAV